MSISNYPGGFAHGVNVRGFPVLNSYGGKVIWVDSGAGSDGNKGTFDRPLATIDKALQDAASAAGGFVTADNGDVIMVKPGHTETIAAASGVTVDVAGVSIIGLGTGAARPNISFTATASTFVISAAGFTLQNVLCTGDVDAIVTMFTISGADCALIDIETRDVTGQMVSCITTATGADRLLIDNYIHRGAAAAGGANCIELVGADDGVTIRDFWIDGNFSVAAIQNVTGVMTNLSVYGDRQCFARTRNAADVILTAVATTTGNIGPNINIRLADNAANITESLVGADMQFYGPLQIVNADGEMPFGVTAVGGIGMINKTASTDA